MDALSPSPPPPPKPKPKPKFHKHMTPSELAAFIQASPKHKAVVRLYTPILIMGFFAFVWTAVSVGTSVGFGWAVVQEHRWLLFHYTVVTLLSASHAAFCWRFRVDIEALEDPSQFQIDIGRIVITNLTQIAFLIYLTFKLRTYADDETFRLGCAVNCPSKRKWMRISPLLTALLLCTLTLAQLWLSLILFHNPVLNPPPATLRKLEAQDKDPESDLDDHSEEEEKGLMKGKKEERRDSGIGGGEESDEERTLVGKEEVKRERREKSLGRGRSRRERRSRR